MAATTLKKLIELGQKYKVAEEEDFLAAARMFVEEARLIAQMRAQIKRDGMTVTKEYVKGRENLTAHPLIQEIPKHADSANKALTTLGRIIETRGEKPEKAEADELDRFRLNV